MNNYYLLKPFVRKTFKNDEVYKAFFKHYFYSKLKESSLPSHTIFVRADVFSDKIGFDFSIPRVETNRFFQDENKIQDRLEKAISSIKHEDTSTQAKVILTFVVKIGEKYCLTDENLNLISDYFEMVEPLFLSGTTVRSAEEQDFIERYCKTELSVNGITFNYSYPILKKMQYNSQAFIIRKNTCYGVINGNGEYIVTPKYEIITPFSIKKEYTYDIDVSDSITEVVYAQVALYICKRSAEHKYDVYDVNGNMIFEKIDDFSPCEEIVGHSQFDSEFEGHVEKIEVKSVYVSICYETVAINSIDNEEFEEYMPFDKSFKYEVKDLQSKIKNTESEQEPKQKAIGNFNSSLNYISEMHYEDILNSPKNLLDIFVMMAETISRIQKLPLKLWLEIDFISVLDMYLKLQKMNVGEILSMDILELDFTVRAFNCLKRAGITTVDELLKLTDDAMSKIRNLGQRGYKEAETMRNVIRWIIDNARVE